VGAGKAIIIAKGIATWIPGLYRTRWRPSDGTAQARYCYTVWLRHLVLARRHGLAGVPESVAELGPGGSLGTGLAALLCGARVYRGLDVTAYADQERNLAVLEELIALVRRREPIPGPAEFPGVYPVLDSYGFPGDILTESALKAALGQDRLGAIRAAVTRLGQPQAGGIVVDYAAPWRSQAVVRRDSVDMIFSQAVLEYVDDMDLTYEGMRLWLRPGGLASHQISFDCHGLAPQWDGHWSYSSLAWRLARGRRPAFINRLPYSAHRRCLREHGFEVIAEMPLRQAPTLSRSRLASEFRDMSEDDRSTSGVFVLAVKSPGAPGAGANISSDASVGGDKP